jgi:hypothetical protein
VKLDIENIRGLNLAVFKLTTVDVIKLSLQHKIHKIDSTLDERPSIYIRDKPIFLSERMLHKDYEWKGSVEKKTVSLEGPDAKTN